MAIALSLLVEMFDLLQRGVNWLGGVPDARVQAQAHGSGASGSTGAPGTTQEGGVRGQAPRLSQGASQAQQQPRTQPQRLWGGPLRIHPTRRSTRMRSSRGMTQHARW